MESVMKVVSRFLKKLVPSEEETRRALEEHRLLIDLIKKKKKRESVEQMARHLVRVEERLASVRKRGSVRPPSHHTWRSPGAGKRKKGDKEK